jgi:lipopolysaccharide export system protein LptA
MIAVAPSEASLPAGVQKKLVGLMRSLHQLAQVGPVKPNGLPPRKPNDPPLPVPPVPVGEPLNVTSDRQEFDINTQTFTAIGNVRVSYAQGELRADRVSVNLLTQDTQAQGNVLFQRGNQIVRGDRLEYNYAKQTGTLTQASGAIDLATLTDPNPRRLPADTASGSVFLSAIAREAQGGVRRIGFTAEKLILQEGNRWVAENLRITNDPFSPPELELITSRATLSPISPTQSQLDLEAPTLAFDRVFFLPVPINSVTLDQFQRPFSTLVAFDRQDRGGAYVQQSFDVVKNVDFNLRIAPQLLLQRAFERTGGLFDRDLLGLVVEAQGSLGDGQFITARGSLSSFDFSQLDKNLRFNLRYSRNVFDDHRLDVSYAYRDRLFSGSAGFEDVTNLAGATITSPNRLLGDTGINLNYQLSLQIVNAIRADLQPNTVGTLGRLQSAVALGRTITLAQGEPLPAEKDAGLRYVPQPIVPSLSAFVGVSGVSALYTNGANQNVLSGTVGLSTVLGNFSRDFLDYTALSVSYTQSFVAGLSPFRFDRVNDQRVITAEILQQIYGPLRFGVSQSWNVDTGNLFDATYSLQYDRRTYGIAIRYNPNQGIGELVLRISDLNWTQPHSEITPVQGGIERQK